MTELTANRPQGHTKAEERLLFAACFVALVATSFAFIIRIILMDTWKADFNLDETQKGQIFGAGFWPFGVSIVLFSLVIDRVGYRRSMIFAFLFHVISAVLLIWAKGYWWLYVGSVFNGLAAGTVEAVINPAVASMYTRKKTTMLSILHAGWPAGMVLGGSLLLLLPASVDWQTKVGVIFIPVMLYGLLLLRTKFPVSERVVAGVSYKDMLKEAGAVGWLIVVYLIASELNNVLAGFGLFKAGGYFFDQFGWGPNLWHTTFFTLPSLPMTILMGILVLAYLLYTRTLGRGLYIFLLLIMMLLATTELGIDSWINDLMKPAMGKYSGWVVIYTAFVMMVLRFCIAPIERALKPLGVLLAGAVFAAAGLYMLSSSVGIAILVFATMYAMGKAFFWPVTLGVVAERFPRGGALTLNIMGGVGMLTVGILGNPLLGFWQDTRIDAKLKASKEHPALYAKVMGDEEKTSVFGSYRSLDGVKEGQLTDKAEKKYIGELQTDAKKTVMARTAVLPSIMALCYLGLIIYFKVRHGGYKAIDLTAEGQAAGEHKPTVKETVRDAERTPSE